MEKRKRKRGTWHCRPMEGLWAACAVWGRVLVGDKHRVSAASWGPTPQIVANPSPVSSTGPKELLLYYCSPTAHPSKQAYLPAQTPAPFFAAPTNNPGIRKGSPTPNHPQTPPIPQFPSKLKPTQTPTQVKGDRGVTGNRLFTSTPNGRGGLALKTVPRYLTPRMCK